MGVHEVFLFGSFSLFSGDGDGEGKGEEGRERKSLCHGSSHPTGQGQVTWTKCQLTAKNTGPQASPGAEEVKEPDWSSVSFLS